MKRMIFVLLAFCFFTQFLKAEDAAVLMWENYVYGEKIDIEFSPTDPDIVVALQYYHSSSTFLNNAFIFDVQTGDTVRIIKFDLEEDDNVMRFTFSNDGEKLIFGTKEHYILVYNISEDRFEKTFQLTENPIPYSSVNDIEFTPDGKYLAVSCSYLYIINADDWTIKQKWNDILYDGSLATPRDISVSFDSKYVSVCYHGNRITVIYDIAKNELMKYLPSELDQAQFLNHSNKIIINQKGYFLEYDLNNDEERKIEPGGVLFLISEDDQFIYKLWTKQSYVVRLSDNTILGTIVANAGRAVKNNKYYITGALEMYDISGVTSVEIDATEQIEISPNPAENILRINNLPIDLQLIEISVIEGRIIDSFAFTHYSEYFEVDISAYLSGTYFVNFITDSSVFTKKFVIKR